MWAKKLLTPIAGIMMVICFFIFTLIALALFPTPFDPMINWVSDLGGYVLNPTGAIFFNMGCIIVAIALFLFTTGFPQWSKTLGTRRKIVYATQVAGYIASLSLAMVAIFTEDNPPPHLFWANMFFNPIWLFIALVGVLTYGYTGKFRLLSISSLAIALFVFISNVLVQSLLEWVAVILIISFFGVIGTTMLSIIIHESKISEK